MVDTTCGTPWPAAFGDTVTADFSFGADADAHLLWCAFHDNGAGAYIDACSTAFGRSTASVLQYAASAAASRCCIYWRSARAVHHNPLPALAQCHATVPKLLEARRRLWMGNNLVCASLSTRGVGTSIPDSADGLRAVGLSFIGLSGLVSGMLPSNPALCDLFNAICCCCCAPPRRYPGTCHTHHHHPSPGHSLTSISSLLTRPSPSLCALSAGLVRRLERPLWPPGRLPGRWE